VITSGGHPTPDRRDPPLVRSAGRCRGTGGPQPRAAQRLLPRVSAAFRAAFSGKGAMRCLPYELRWRSFLRDLPANPPRTSTSSPARPFSWRRSAVVLRFWRTLREGRLVVSSGLVAGRWDGRTFLVRAAGSHQWGELLTCGDAGDAGDRGPKSPPSTTVAVFRCVAALLLSVICSRRDVVTLRYLLLGRRVPIRFRLRR
jgi:hypothetical protein